MALTPSDLNQCVVFWH